MSKKIVAAGLALAALTLAPYSANAAKSGNRVRVEDRCEQASFDAAIGPGTCVGNGTTTFDEFLETLNPVDFGDHHWRFKVSGGSTIKLGQSISVVNTGGEFHTFTEVAQFGGGCVPIPFLNLGEPPVAECQPEAAPGVPVAFGTSGVPAGGSRTIAGVSPGTHLYQCLIHPWMRSVAVVEDDD